MRYWLKLPPALWQDRLAREAADGRMLVSRLQRNMHNCLQELIAWRVEPAPGELPRVEDWLVVRLQESVRPGDAERLLQEFRTPSKASQRQLILALVLGRGAAAGQWIGAVMDRDRVRPLDGLTLVGPGMTAVGDSPDITDHTARDRWSRTIGALTETVWRRVRQSSIGVIGCGRNGSTVLQSLAMLGVREVVIADADHDQEHNLDATVGLEPELLGRPKVVNRQAWLRTIRPDDLAVTPLPHAVPHPQVLEALRAVDLIVTCVDRDAARLAVAHLANRWCKPHLDIGSGIFGTGGARQSGIDVRVLLPGQACVICLGGVRRSQEALRELTAPPGALRQGPSQSWFQERAGSLVNLNQIAAGLAVQMWLDLLGGSLESSQWLHLEWGTRGIPALHSEGTPNRSCSICHSPPPPP